MSITFVKENQTYNLTSGQYYSLNEWARAIAQLRTDPLSGRTIYEDVAESLNVNILPNALQNQANLVNVGTYADAWSDSAGYSDMLYTQSPAIITVQEPGSSLPPLQAAILGTPPGEQFVNVPPRYRDDLVTGTIENAELRLIRRGLWLGALETSGTATGAPSGTIQSLTFAAGNTAVECPIDLFWGGFTAGTGSSQLSTLPAGVLLYGRVQILEAEALAAATDYASQADSTARGGARLRFTPTVTSNRATAWSGAPASVTVQRMAVFALVRNNDPTKEYVLQIEAEHSGGTTLGEEVVIKAGVSGVQVVPLGLVTTNTQWKRLRLLARTSATGGTLDIDYLATVEISNTSGAVAHDAIPLGTVPNVNFTILHRQLTHVTPFVGIREQPDPLYQSDYYTWRAGGHRGPLPIMSKSGTFDTAWLLPSGSNWRATANDGTTVLNLSVLAQRRRAYLVPE